MPSGGFSFPAFAKVCIQRHIITAIKTATRQKQMPLNTSLSLESPADDSGHDWNLSDILPSSEALDPEELVNVLVHVVTDVFARSPAHQYELCAPSGE